MQENTIQNRLYKAFNQYAEKVAVEYGERKITYSGLDKQSEAVNRFMVLNRYEKGSFVGILTDNRVDLLALILGVLKAGCIFIPMDPKLPSKRLESMLACTGSRVVFVDERNHERHSSVFHEKGIRTVVVNEGFYRENACDYPVAGTPHSPEDPIYVYFTSGSTGEPKAILGRNRSLLHFIEWEIETFGINEDFRISQLTSPGFDASLRDFFIPLCSGGTVCIPENREEILETERLVKWVENTGVDLIHCTPTMFRLLNSTLLTAENLKKLKYILMSGEKLNPPELSNWFQVIGERIQLVNLYGATETTMVKTFYFIQASDVSRNSIPVGKPMRGTRVVILNENMNPCNEGDVGEIYIRTAYGTFGYYKDADLNQEKFVRNPFSSNPDDKIYKTGDLGRFLSDGNLEFLGRMDRQVKVRGIRVELSEIENVLLTCENVGSAVVTAKEEENGNTSLCAYIVEDIPTGEGLDSLQKEWRDHAAQKLPEYMIPRYFTVIGKLPLTSNGKLDYKALPEPQKIEDSLVAPRDEIESKLLQIWEEILGVSNIGVHVDFFRAGGHSMNAMALVSRVFQEYEIELPLGEIFINGTVEGLANYIRGVSGSGISKDQTAEKAGTNPEGYYPATSAQSRLYILNKLEEKSTAYNMPVATLIEGKIDKARLEQAFNSLIERHEALRTSFHLIDGVPQQKIHRDAAFKIEYTEAEEDHLKEKVLEWIQPFELDKAPLLRVGLVKTGLDRHVLFCDMHHIVSDGVSQTLLVKEFAELYQGQSLKPLSYRYRDYALRLKEMYENRDTNKIGIQERYWLNKFSGEIPVLNLPVDFTRPGMTDFCGSSLGFGIEKETLIKLNGLARQEGASLFVVLISAYYVLLSKYSGQDDIVVGSPIAGRHHANLENIIGVFINTLPLRNKPQGCKKFMEFVRDVRECVLEAFENQEYPFEELVEKLDLNRDISRNPLFDTMFVMQNMDRVKPEVPGLRFVPYEVETETVKFDLLLYASEDEEGIRFNLEYCTRLFRKETILHLANHYKNILEYIVGNPDTIISEIDMMSLEEKQQLVFGLNRTEAEYPKHKCIHELFEEQVAKTPEYPAVVFGDSVLTYKELNSRSNRLAAMLREKGVKPDRIIAIMAERSFHMIIGILAVLKAGGAYLPIDPSYPCERIRYLINDSGTSILLTYGALPGKTGLEGLGDGIQVVDMEDEALNAFEDSNPLKACGPGNLAYVIYTSGSTGSPKGAMIEHYSVVNRIHWMQSKYPLTQTDVILQKTPYTFDVSVWELLWWSAAGARVCFLEPGGEKDPEAIADAVQKNAVTVMHFVPSMLSVFMDYVESMDKVEKLKTLRHVFASGEALKPKQVKSFNRILGARFGTRLSNLYGPTEATVDVTYYDCPVDEDPGVVPIGKPIDNIRLYVLDKNRKLQPLGIPGELFIAGDGLARGYLNRPELTKEKFVESGIIDAPWLKISECLYGTGDLVKWNTDGNIEFLGRMDHQVKIRGFRIEPGEIEKQLLTLKSVKEALVIDRAEKDGSRYLCAYVVCDDEENTEKLKESLIKVLPEYMIPSYIVRLESIPLSPNGKIDRKQLPEPYGTMDSGKPYILPTSKTEVKLAELWRGILGAEKVGLEDNFFSLGGHSLKATVMASRIHREFGVDIPLREIFRTPTLQQISKYIELAVQETYYEIPVAVQREYYPVSSAQKRMYILNQLERGKKSYNMSGMVRIEGPLDCDRVKIVLEKLVERHDAFRTAFELVDGEAFQRIYPNVDFALDYAVLEYTHRKQEEIKQSIEKVFEEFVHPFELDKAPLFHAKLLRLSEELYILMTDMHHIIADGTSMGVLMREFASLYKGDELPPLRIQYKDFTLWQRESLENGRINQQKEFWMGQLKGDIPRLEMPTDFERPATQSFEGERMDFRLESESTGRLKMIASETGTTLYMVLLAAYNILLSKYTAKEDILIGCGIAGRHHADLENVIGMFVNMLVLRNHPSGGKTFAEFLSEVRENTLAAYENQDYQFEELVDDLKLDRNPGHNPLFDVIFVLQNMELPEVETGEIRFLPYESMNRTSKFDISLYAFEAGEMLEFQLEYCTQLFKRETIERFIADYRKVLKSITADMNMALGDIELESNFKMRDRVIRDEIEFSF